MRWFRVQYLEGNYNMREGFERTVEDSFGTVQVEMSLECFANERGQAP
jgi:hypothetical protein